MVPIGSMIGRSAMGTAIHVVKHGLIDSQAVSFHFYDPLVITLIHLVCEQSVICNKPYVYTICICICMNVAVHMFQTLS